MKKSSICILSPEGYPLTNWGGVATFNNNLAILASDLGYNVHIIVFSPSGEYIKQKSDFTFHAIPFSFNNKIINFIYFNVVRLFLSPIILLIPSTIFLFEWTFFCYIYFKNLRSTEKIYILHTPTFYASGLLIKLLMRKKIKLINHVHGRTKQIMPPHSNKIDYIIKSKIENLYLRHFSDDIIVPNESLRQEAKWHIKKEINIDCIPNFVTGSLIVDHTQKPNKNIYCFWGRIEHGKGIESMIDVYIDQKKKYKKLRLYLIGEQTKRLKYHDKFFTLTQYVKLQKMSQRAQDDIIHIPRIDNKVKLRNTITQLNGINIFPSLYESFGLAALESMFWGLLTIASTKSQAVNFIDDGNNGFLCEPNSVSLQIAIDKIRVL